MNRSERRKRFVFSGQSGLEGRQLLSMAHGGHFGDAARGDRLTAEVMRFEVQMGHGGGGPEVNHGVDLGRMGLEGRDGQPVFETYRGEHHGRGVEYLPPVKMVEVAGKMPVVRDEPLVVVGERVFVPVARGEVRPPMAGNGLVGGGMLSNAGLQKSASNGVGGGVRVAVVSNGFTDRSGGALFRPAANVVSLGGRRAEAEAVGAVKSGAEIDEALGVVDSSGINIFGFNAVEADGLEGGLVHGVTGEESVVAGETGAVELAGVNQGQVVERSVEVEQRKAERSEMAVVGGLLQVEGMGARVVSAVQWPGRFRVQVVEGRGGDVVDKDIYMMALEQIMPVMEVMPGELVQEVQEVDEELVSSAIDAILEEFTGVVSSEGGGSAGMVGASIVAAASVIVVRTVRRSWEEEEPLVEGDGGLEVEESGSYRPEPVSVESM